MSIDLLIESMQKLLKLHKSLLELSLKKTGILETEDIQALTQLLKEEQAHILAIRKSKRSGARTAGERTLMNCLKKLPDPQKENLEEISEGTPGVQYARIQEQNELNQGSDFASP